MRLSSAAIVLSMLALGAPRAAAQPAGGPFEVAAQVVTARVHEFDRADAGVGGRIAWRPIDALGLEAELNWFPGEFPDTVPFSRSRLEGLFGATLGPTLGRVRPFVRFRGGFLDVAEAPRAYACILIYPPPLACVLAGGRTLPAFDVGGGVELQATPRLFFRVDVGDRVLKYPGPAFSRGSAARAGDFYSHAFRLAAGAGVRF